MGSDRFDGQAEPQPNGPWSGPKGDEPTATSPECEPASSLPLVDVRRGEPQTSAASEGDGEERSDE